MNETNAWDITDTESGAAYEAFSAYMDIPRRERSVLAAYRQITGRNDATQAPGQWNLWSTTHRWVERARAWDAHKARVEREARVEADLSNLDMRDRVAKAMLAKLAQAMSKTEPERIRPGAWAQIAKAASDILDASRVARAEIVETQTETLPTDGYDVLDSLRESPELAPLLQFVQESGVDLEPDAGESGGDA